MIKLVRMRLCLAVMICVTWGDAGAQSRPVDHDRLINAASEPEQWLSHGRDYAEQRHSTLTQIHRDNVDQLGLDWSFELPTKRGQEATPLVVDGTLFVTGSWSMVFALDARSGELKWRYDPQVPRSRGKFACCDAVNRGVAFFQGRVYVGTLDGRLIALDAQSGEPVWSVQTTPTAQRYTITGAPRVVKGRVLIGNGGGEFGVRGYVSAYNAETGELDWRFYTVPGNPADGFESPILKMAADTWNGEWWRLGGGGTVWDSMSYDPELDLLYIGVGNGSPWRRDLRSPGGGDNLFLSSIVALRPDSGEYVWHYQTTPGDTWDYTATQHMILADIPWQGRTRKVLMQAPKNGFFYVLDRLTGELLSAEPFVPVNWASGVDPVSGRPVETGIGYDKKAQLTRPSPLGGHNWQPMAFNPQTGWVYIPVIDGPFTYAPTDTYPRDDDLWRTGADFAKAATPVAIAPALEEALIRRLGASHLLAWDPLTQTAQWKVQQAHPWNGGVLSTAGGLVFQGDATGQFNAFDARTGALLWQRPSNTGIVAAPITYAIDGVQYVAVLAGWGGSMPLTAGRVNGPGRAGVNGRLLVYRLGGRAAPPPGAQPVVMLRPPRNRALDRDINNGFALYARHCSTCHGANAVSGGVLPDLRHLSSDTHAVFQQIVGAGVLEANGMPGFAERLTQSDIEAIHAYVIFEANREYARQDDAGWWRATKNAVADVGAWLIAKAL